MNITELTDVNVWFELTWSDIDQDSDEPPLAHFTAEELTDEIDRRWGPDALDRVATVITVGHFSSDDELSWLHTDPESFMRIVTGAFLATDWFAELFFTNDVKR